jgi:hypothetical protein
LRVVSRGPIHRWLQKKLRRLVGTAAPTRKGSLGRHLPSFGMLVGLLLALTWRAASALLTSFSWCGLCQQTDWAPLQLGACPLAPWACSWSLQGHELDFAVSGTLVSSKRFFCCQWLACSNTLACPWWSLEGSLAATQNWPISYQNVLVNLAACWHSCLKNNQPSACCYSCWASAEGRLWIHNIIRHWAYPAKNK